MNFLCLFPACLQNLWQCVTLKNDKGQSTIEFALVFTFIIIPFTLVFIETSLLLYEYVALTNAAREGVRAGSIYLYVGDPGGTTTLPDAGRSTAVVTAIQETLGPLIASPPDCNGTTAGTTCQITYGAGITPGFTDPLRSSEAMTITLTHTHPFLFGALGNTVDFQAQASMKIEPSAVISGSGP